MRSTFFMDLAAPAVQAFADRVVGAATAPEEVAGLIFRAVRDEIRYDPHHLPTDPAAYRASAVLAAGTGYCVPKAVVLVAVARHCGIPARLGFSDVRNHLQSERLAAAMGSDLFLYHGYAVLHLNGQWLKASPAFNRELCERVGVTPLEFDGSHDALLHPFDATGSRYMEYVRDHGTFDDLPLRRILDTYARAYPGLSMGPGVERPG
ncbi:MAG: transglutaminase [Actinobacteria bacterium]|nr:transglutaminase [Actinomycetota bacterium]